MGKRIIIITCIVICFFGAIIPKAWAVAMLQLSIKELALRADCIIVAKCIDKKDIWDPFEPNVDTFATFKIKEYLKNDLGISQITVRHLNEHTQFEDRVSYDGLSFQPDEEVILFLTEKDLDGYRHVFGLSQGKILINKDRAGYELSRNVDGVVFCDIGSGAEGGNREDGGNGEAISGGVDEFKKRICQILYSAGDIE